MKRYISIILTIALLASLLAGIGAVTINGEPLDVNQITQAMKDDYSKAMGSKTPDNSTIGQEFVLIDSNEKLELYAVTNTESKRVGEIAVKDKTSGYVWRSNPVDADKDIVAQSSGDAYTKSMSQITLQYSEGFDVNKYKNSYKDSVEKGLVKCEVSENSVKFIYSFEFPDMTVVKDREDFIAEVKETGKNKNNINIDDFGKNHYFVVPVKYSISDDSFNAEIIADEEAVLHFTKPGTDGAADLGGKVWRNVDYNILKIELLPAFGATSFNESGYMFIPDGSGALVEMNNGRKNIQQPYMAPVFGNYKERSVDKNAENGGTYNEYYRSSDRFMLPVFGTVKEDGHALMGIIADNASVSYVNVVVSGYESVYNKVYPSFLNKIVSDVAKIGSKQPINKELRDTEKNYSVKYYCLSGEEADYVGMAKRYRQYLIEEQGMEKSNDYREGALVLDMYAGVEKKTSILGIPWNKFEVLTTYKDLIRISDELTTEGIENIVFKYNDWIKKSSRKEVQVKPAFEGAIGGKKGYKEAYKHLSEKNISLYMNVDFVNYSESGNGYSVHSDSVKYTNQAPAYQTSGMSDHINMGNRWCLLKAPLVKEAALKFADKCDDNNIAAVAIENIGTTVYTDGANKNGHTRGECVNQFAEIIKAYKEKGIKVLISEPSEYALINTDILMDIPSKDSYVELVNEAVPFYQIAMRGYKTYTTEAINMSSRPEDIILNAVESGSSLSYSFVAGATDDLKETYLKYLYSCNYGQWKDELVEEYKKYSAVMNEVAGADIDKHEKVADDVYATTYSNGVKVYVNYTNSDYQTAGGVLVPAKGYVSERGGQA